MEKLDLPGIIRKENPKSILLIVPTEEHLKVIPNSAGEVKINATTAELLSAIIRSGKGEFLGGCLGLSGDVAIYYSISESVGGKYIPAMKEFLDKNFDKAYILP